MLDQPQFGSILHDSELETLTEADLRPAYRTAWAARLDRLTLYELREGRMRKQRQRRGKTVGGD